MSKVAALKAQAANLKQALEEQGLNLTQGQALEAIARQYGMENWDTLCGVAKACEQPKREPALADLEYVPSRVWVERGASSTACVVELYDEALALLPDETKLKAHLAAYPEHYGLGLASTAMYLLGDGHDIELTFEQVLGLKYVALGGGEERWLLADGETYLRFDERVRPTPKAAAKLCVPQVVKSVKGCQLIALRSHDGSAYDHFALVPPHLDAKTVNAKLSAGVSALKDRDAGQKEDSAEYTDRDVRTLVQGLGCLWIDTPLELGQNWDC